MPNILIVEDDININNLLCEVLTKSGYECEQAFSGTEAKLLLNMKENAYTLVLLDLMLPGASGEDVLKEIRKKGKLPVIVLTAKDSIDDKIGVLTDGADDYITKPYSPTILLLRIQNIFKRLDNSTEVLKYKDLEVSPSRGTLSGSNKELELTKNEMLIFQHLLNNQNRIVSRDELMTILWNNEEYITDNALTVNISRLRSKLEDFGYPNAIETRKGQGYILL